MALWMCRAQNRRRFPRKIFPLCKFLQSKSQLPFKMQIYSMKLKKRLEASGVGYGDVSREAWSKILRNQPRIGFIATPPTTRSNHILKLSRPISPKPLKLAILLLGVTDLTISMPSQGARANHWRDPPEKICDLRIMNSGGDQSCNRIIRPIKRRVGKRTPLQRISTTRST